MSKEVKLNDIATRLGISVVSVSKALSGQKGVSEKTRMEVKKLASEMGYVSPTEARLLEEKKSFNIGVLVSKKYFNQTQSFYWLMYQELATRAVSQNCFTMLEVIREEDEVNPPKLLEGNRINGLVIIGCMKKDYLDLVKTNSRVPIVYLDFYVKDDPCDAVVSNNYFGMYQLTDYLIQKGHRKIAYVGTLRTTDSITDRYFGYCKALLQSGIEIRSDYVVKDRFDDTGDMNGFNIKLPNKNNMPTAFAVNCDMAAIKLIDKLTGAGYRVPEDISVVGFDDYVFPSTGSVELTTYAVNVKEMVWKTLKILIRRMSGEEFDKTVVVVDGKMVIRDSVNNN